MKQLLFLVLCAGCIGGSVYLWGNYHKQSIVLLDQPSLPLPVAETRSDIFYFVTSKKFQELALLAGDDMKYVSEGRIPGGAYDFWEQYAFKSLQVIPNILNQPYEYVNGVYIWPGFFIRSAGDWTEQDLRVLNELSDQEDIDSFQEFGVYTGYRIGIDRDGKWIFFLDGE